MPNKTIYVSDGDLPLFQRAQELAGNLSAAISTALRRYVEIEEGRQEGFDEVVVKVGQRGNLRKQRFSGALVGEWGRAKGSRVELFRVYRTRKGRYALYTERQPEWKGQGTGENWLRELADWQMLLGLKEQNWGFVEGESTLEVFDAIEDLRDRLPAEFYDLIAGGADRPVVEDLDI